jgi:hypothetical protein
MFKTIFKLYELFQILILAKYQKAYMTYMVKLNADCF